MKKMLFCMLFLIMLAACAAPRPSLVASAAAEALLLQAAEQGDEEIVEFLLKRDAGVNTANGTSWTALQGAAFKGYTGIVKLLLEYGADPNSTMFFRDETPLHYASCKGHAEICALLVENGANPEKRNYDGRTPLHNAVDIDDLETVTVLLAGGADINGKRVSPVGLPVPANHTPFYSAVKHGHRDLVELMLGKGADVNVVESDRTPLDWALELSNSTGGGEQHSEIAVLLKKHGALTAEELNQE